MSKNPASWIMKEKQKTVRIGRENIFETTSLKIIGVYIDKGWNFKLHI